MHTLTGRTTALIGSGVALVLLGMQLRSEGASGYDMGDVLSIVVAVLPVLLHGARARGPRRSSHDAPDDDVTADEGLDEVRSSGEAQSVGAVGPDLSSDPGALVQRLVSDGAAWLLAGSSWALTVVLVVLQAWPAALSALIVFVVAASTIQPAQEQTPASVRDRRGDRHG